MVKLFSIKDVKDFRLLHNWNSQFESLGFPQVEFKSHNGKIDITEMVYTSWEEVF